MNEPPRQHYISRLGGWQARTQAGYGTRLPAQGTRDLQAIVR